MTDFRGMDGEEITVAQWAKLFSDVAGRTLATDDFDGGTVKTMWIGLIEPLVEELRLFGTAVCVNGVYREVASYATKQQALDGHERILRNLRLESGGPRDGHVEGDDDR